MRRTAEAGKIYVFRIGVNYDFEEREGDKKPSSEQLEARRRSFWNTAQLAF